VLQLADFLRILTLCLDFFARTKSESEAAHDSHVLGAIASSVAREIILELDVEQPVHALNAPVTAHPVGEPLDVENSRRDIVAGLECAAISVFDTRIDLDQRLDVGVARVDTTVVETNIHYPTDSTLLADGVRMLTRVMRRSLKRFPVMWKHSRHG
jgi:hypothetical protein